MTIFEAFAVLCLLLWMGNAVTIPEVTEDDPTNDLDKWLREVRFILPDGKIPEVQKNFDFGFLGSVSVHLKVGQLTCQGVSVGGLDPIEAQTAQWGFHLSQTGWKCDGKVHYWTTSGGPLKLSGDADAEVSATDSDITATLGFNSSDEGDNRLPDSLLLQSCNSQLKARLKLLGGSTWTQLAKMLPGVEASLSELVAKQLDELACHDIASLIIEEANTGLKMAHDTAKAWLQAPAPSIPEGNSSYVMWGDLSEVQWAQQMSQLLMENNFYSTLLQKVFADGTVCFFGEDCFLSKKNFCLLGGSDDSDCLVRHNFHGQDKPAVLRVEATTARVAPEEPAASLEASNESNSIKFGAATSRSNVEVNLSLNFTGWAGGAEAKDMGGDIVFRFGLDGSKVSLAVLAKFEKNTFNKVPPYRRYRALGCVADSYSDMEVLDILFDGSLMGPDLSVSPQEKSTSALGRGSIAVTNNVIQTLFTSYGSLAVPVLQGALRSNLLQDATTMLQSWSHSQVDTPCPKALGEETKGLGDHPLIDPGMSVIFIITAWVIAAISAFMMLSTSRLKVCGRRVGFLASSAAEPMLPTHSTGSLTSGSSRGSLRTGLSKLAKLAEGSLCQSQPVIPKPLRFGMPVMIIALILFVVGSNYMEMASTFLEIRMGDESHDVPIYQVMVYSLFYSIHELRRVKLAFLADVVLLFSGVVPYMKLGLLFLAWVLPKKLFPWQQRGQVLLWLDMIGKFSLVDVFVIEFISAALATDVSMNKALSGQEDTNTVSIILRTGQSMGFSSFVLATVGSLIIGHISLYYHSQTKEDEEPEPGPIARCGAWWRRLKERVGCCYCPGCNPLTACKRFFQRIRSSCSSCSSRCSSGCSSRCSSSSSSRCSGNRCSNNRCTNRCSSISSSYTSFRSRYNLENFREWRQSERASALFLDSIAPCLFVTMILVIFGGFFTAFTVELKTPFGSLGEKSHSFFGLAGRLAACTPHPTAITTIFGQVTYIMFAMVFVLLHLALLLAFWAGQVPVDKLVRARTAARTLLAWSALDVVVLSMIVTLLEMSTSNFVYLNGADRHWVETLTGHDPGHQGLDVHITLGPGTYILSIAALAHYFVSYVVMGKMSAAIEKHERGDDIATELASSPV